MRVRIVYSLIFFLGTMVLAPIFSVGAVNALEKNTTIPEYCLKPPGIGGNIRWKNSLTFSAIMGSDGHSDRSRVLSVTPVISEREWRAKTQLEKINFGQVAVMPVPSASCASLDEQIPYARDPITRRYILLEATTQTTTVPPAAPAVPVPSTALAVPVSSTAPAVPPTTIHGTTTTPVATTQTTTTSTVAARAPGASTTPIPATTMPPSVSTTSVVSPQSSSTPTVGNTSQQEASVATCAPDSAFVEVDLDNSGNLYVRVSDKNKNWQSKYDVNKNCYTDRPHTMLVRTNICAPGVCLNDGVSSHVLSPHGELTNIPYPRTSNFVSLFNIDKNRSSCWEISFVSEYGQSAWSNKACYISPPTNGPNSAPFGFSNVKSFCPTRNGTRICYEYSSPAPPPMSLGSRILITYVEELVFLSTNSRQHSVTINQVLLNKYTTIPTPNNPSATNGRQVGQGSSRPTGNCYGCISSTTGRPKTNYVGSYFRGSKQVGGYWRS